MPTMPHLNELTSRRSTRVRKVPDRYDPSANFNFGGYSVLFCMVTMVSMVTNMSVGQSNIGSTMASRFVYHTQIINQHFDGILNYLSPFALTTSTADNDTYNFKEMLQQEDRAEFIKAMMDEINDHESRDYWHLFERNNIPSGHKTILAIWSFKRKRFPDGRIMKYKARLCAHGGMQQWGVDYWETYAPVVNWLSVRTLLALSILHGYHSRSIDFVLAFPQADLDLSLIHI